MTSTRSTVLTSAVGEAREEVVGKMLAEEGDVGFHHAGFGDVVVLGFVIIVLVVEALWGFLALLWCCCFLRLDVFGAALATCDLLRADIGKNLTAVNFVLAFPACS